MQATLSRQAITATPMIKSQPVNGSNKTSKIPRPKPIKQTASVFLSILKNILLPPILFYI